MPKLATPLTERQVRNASPKQKPYKLGDGGGLYLLVDPSGKCFWRMKYHRGNKETSVSFGAYPDVSLSMARAERDKAHALLAEGKDPVAVKGENAQQARAAQPAANAKFRLSLNSDGALIIEKPTNRMRLNAAQVAALRAFLLAANDESQED